MLVDLEKFAAPEKIVQMADLACCYKVLWRCDLRVLFWCGVLALWGVVCIKCGAMLVSGYRGESYADGQKCIFGRGWEFLNCHKRGTVCSGGDVRMWQSCNGLG